MARDAYIRSMTSCSAGFITGTGGSGGFGLPAGSFQICEPPSTTLPRSFTLNSSTTTTATRERCRFVSGYYSQGGGGGETTAATRPLDLRRNYSCVVMGRIDEEKSCDEFDEKDLNRTEISPPSVKRSATMLRREEKRRKLHEALLQTLYPPSSPSSPSSSPSRTEFDEEPFDVTLINPEDYVNIDKSNNGDGNENDDASGIAEKPRRAQRKRVRKKMLKEEASRRKKMIGPLLPTTEMCQTPDERLADASGSNVEVEEACGGEKEADCLQLVRSNVQEKEGQFSGNEKTRKVKRRRDAKKQAKVISKIP
ncbi:unnamed protein product [Microthlaspi erraticum]|uniref:Uncharacterized protein n=1 Tax=Microthlaspi erraticum TaxID=1685480 RepID=A0A6D2J504_9BRAS|nr:unnamed protein product [Microthlaspi erraticum]